jgi:hypothetical protein
MKARLERMGMLPQVGGREKEQQRNGKEGRGSEGGRQRDRGSKEGRERKRQAGRRPEV